MKIVQIGSAGHAFYAYNAVKAHGYDIAAIAAGSAGVTAEGTKTVADSLKKRGFSAVLYENWREMLTVEKPDIAIVNPWFNDIAAVSRYALEKGIHVFSEKPLAHSLDELAELEAVLSHTDAKLAGMFGIRYESAFQTAKKAVTDGKIGKVRMMDARKSYKLGNRPAFYASRDTYCGILPWVAIHAIDWMQWLSGERYTGVSALHSVRDNGNNGDMDIPSATLFSMTNDVIASVTADMYRPSTAPTHGDDRVRLVGTKGILEVTDGAVTLISSDTVGKEILPPEPAADIFEDFLHYIDGKPSGLSAEEAIEATKWAIRADMSAVQAELS